MNFRTEEKLLLRPFSFYVKSFNKSSLFAGKMHALLFRKWKNRVKRRDWYDLKWYIKKGIPLDLDYFLARVIDTNDWQDKSISKQQVLKLLESKINSVSFSSIKKDVVRFILNDDTLKIWSPAYFKDLLAKLNL